MAHDYRYFPDPDLMPVQVDEKWKARIQAACPELPFDKQRRFQAEYAIPYTLTSVLVPDLALSDFFEETARLSGKPQAAGNWIANDLLRELSLAKLELAEGKMKPAHLAALIKLIEGGALSNQSAREIFAEMFRTGSMPEPIVASKGLGNAATSGDELESWCRTAIAGDPKALAEFKGGKESAINAFKGPIMKAAKGRANPKQVDETLRRLLSQ
jgi:aspartyl-tRNA(Asn)/glutamyl-tRNA(Gln) amidotransferase subunit B